MSNSFDFAKAIEQAKAKLAKNKLNAIILAPSGGGKSSLMGTMGVPTLYLHCSSETHGPQQAGAFATGELTPICIDDGRTPDEAIEFLEALLSDSAFLAAYEGIAFDSGSGLERVIKETSEFKAGILTDKGKINKFAESDVVSSIFNRLIKLLQSTGKHTAMSLALDVKAIDGETGEILDANPKLSTYSVAETVIMCHGDVMIIGPMTKDDKTAHRIQFGGKVSKTSKDAAGQVKKFHNFTPRLAGIKTLPSSLPAKLSEVIKLKEGK